MKEPTKLEIMRWPDRFGNKMYGFTITDDEGNGRIVGHMEIPFGVTDTELETMFAMLKAGKVKWNI